MVSPEFPGGETSMVSPEFPAWAFSGNLPYFRLLSHLSPPVDVAADLFRDENRCFAVAIRNLHDLANKLRG